MTSGSNVLKTRSNLNPKQLQRTRELMDAHVSDCLVTGFEDLMPAIKLLDEKDRHVLAAANCDGADMIVTSIKNSLRRIDMFWQQPIATVLI